MNRAKRAIFLANQAKQAEQAEKDQQQILLAQNGQPDKQVQQVQPIQQPQHIEIEDVSAIDDWDPLAEDYNSTKNTLTLDEDRDPMSLVDGRVRPISSKIGNVHICEHYARYGNCADGHYCDRLHISPRSREKIWAIQNTCELNKNRVCMNYTYLSPIELKPDPSVLLLVSVTNAASPNNFYFIAPYESMNFSQHTEEDLKFFIDRVANTSSVKVKLQKCHEQLAALFDHPYRIDNVNDEIYLSQIVACKLKDGRFRRAMVVDVPDYSTDKFNYKLQLIDIGIEVELPRESLYDIKAQCLSEPPTAVNSRLDIMPAEGFAWPKEALETFELEARGEKYWLCKIINYMKYDNVFTVDLYHPKTRFSLTERFIKSGMAKRSVF